MKGQFHSKTVWLSILIAALASLNYLYLEVTDPRALSLIMLATAIGHYVLRHMTTEPLK